MPMIAGAAIAAAGSAGSAYLKGNAAKHALDAQKDAIRKLQYIDVGLYKKEALQADRENYANKLETLRRKDPALYKLRGEAINTLLDAIHGTEQDDIARNKLFDESISQAEDPIYKAIEQDLLARAQEKLQLGSKLSPDFQAEMVRTGLEQSGRVGSGTNRTSALSTLLGNKLGTAGLELENLRENQAKSAITTAAGLRQNRLSILSGLVPAMQTSTANKANLGIQGLGAASSTNPGGGFNANDMIGAMEANRSQGNAAKLAIGQLRGQGHLAEGEMWSSILSSGTNFLGSLVGGMGGAGGQGGGIGGMLGGLLTKK